MKEMILVDQAAGENRWDGEDVDEARQRLAARVAWIQKTRHCTLDAAISQVYLEQGPVSRRSSAAPELDAFRKARDRMLGLRPANRTVNEKEFAHWINTGRLVGAGVPARLKLESEERRAAFVDAMVRVEHLVAHGLSVQRACARLVGEAMESTSEAPNEVRRLLVAAGGSGGRRAPDAVSKGLPSSMTVSKWFWLHQTRQVVVAIKAPAATVERVRRSATYRWKAAARKLTAANPDLQPLALHMRLVLDWRKSWGKPVNRKVFVAWVKDGCPP